MVPIRRFSTYVSFYFNMITDTFTHMQHFNFTALQGRVHLKLLYVTLESWIYADAPYDMFCK